MKFIDEYRDAEIVQKIAQKFLEYGDIDISLMEVCGGHTMAIQRFGIPSLLPKGIKLLSGPGCPVCVSSVNFIDKAIAYSRLENVIITTYGDLIRVPGSVSSLGKEKSKGADVRIIYSALDALGIAQQNKNKKVIFLGIGFETTAPASAIVVQKAYKDNISNFYLLSAHKIMPPVMEALLNDEVKIDGFICPGHVSTITGSEIYNFIPKKYKIGCVITGFEPVDLMHAIYMLVKQIVDKKQKVEIQYSRAVCDEGNTKAQAIMNEVFVTRNDCWRGIGEIPDSGLTLREKYKEIDAEYHFNVEVQSKPENSSCICGNILRGLKTPNECNLFGKVCSPHNPIGACMVSSEGACAAYYKYRKNG